MNEAQTLTHALGGHWRGQSGLAPCPVCQSERRTDQRALSIRAEGGALLAFCHKSGCDFRAIVQAAGLPRDTLRLDPVAAREADVKRAAYSAEQLAKARRLWGQCKPLAGTKGETYLRGRGITCALPASLGWASDAYHAPSAFWACAMVADVSTGGVHRTFFDKRGARLSNQPKMMQGPCAGGAVDLTGGPQSGPHRAAWGAPKPLVVCEGIETGLSLLSGLLSRPASVWAALGTSGMKALALPLQVGELVIAADGDNPGLEAANALAERASAKGWHVMLWPAPDGQDWNDVLRKGMAV